jgi:hypothetical protein
MSDWSPAHAASLPPRNAGVESSSVLKTSNAAISALRPPRFGGWPDFFIVGAQNSATSSLHTYLRRHPQVFMPALKEPHYFSQLGPIRQMRYPTTHVGDREAYLKLFAKAPLGTLKGEASSSYLWDAAAPLRIHTRQPSARILIIVRDPVARAYSQYLMDIREGRQELPFYEALHHDFSLEPKGYGITRLYVELGLYCEQVRRYLNIFGEDQVKIIPFKSLTSSLAMGQGLLEEILAFLELDTQQLRTDTLGIENQNGVPRWDWARRAAGSRLVRCLGRALVPARLGSTYTIKRLLFDKLLTKRASPPPMDLAAKQWLISIYDPDVTALERLLQRTIPELRASW